MSTILLIHSIEIHHSIKYWHSSISTRGIARIETLKRTYYGRFCMVSLPRTIWPCKNMIWTSSIEYKIISSYRLIVLSKRSQGFQKIGISWKSHLTCIIKSHWMKTSFGYIRGINTECRESIQLTSKCISS